MHEMQKFNSVDELVNTVRPVDPIYCIRPNSIKSACTWFKSNFPGQILYAVKTNPIEKIVKYIGENGIAFGIDNFGKSAPYKEIYEHFGLTSKNIVKKVKEMINNKT